MILETLFSKLPFAQVLSKPTTNISGVSTDSNLVEPGDLFIPLFGKKTNGYQFINQAVQKGAAAIAGDEIRSKRANVACVFLPHAEAHVPWISANVYGNPSRRLKVIGVTGTSGKTTVAHILEAMLRATKKNKAGYIGTTAYRWAKSHQDAKYTTPPSPQLQRIFRKMVDSEVDSVVLECSSHGIEQGRLDYTQFDGAIFTNLTQNHLDYHKNFVSYRNAKWKLFSSLLEESEKKEKFAVLNIDDSSGRSWSKENLKHAKMVTYSLEPRTKAMIYPETFQQNQEGIHAKIHLPNSTLELDMPIVGRFSLQNVLAALGAAHAMSLDMKEIKELLDNGVHIPGRMEKMFGTKNFQVYVDFAHTEDSLDQALSALQTIKQKRIITVFGCGGEANEGKRRRMGKVAAERSDIVVITSDNPRHEDPDKILNDIFSGIDDAYFSKKEIFRITKREEAIVHALKMAQKDDIVLIAGKGHENYQEINGVRYPFEDRKIVKNWTKP